MEQLVVQLVKRACAEQVVTSSKLANGMQLLAYPLAAGVLIAIGLERDLAYRINAESLLRKRSADPARFGAWLPALFADGSCYVVRRLLHFNHGSEASPLSLDELAAAQELLS